MVPQLCSAQDIVTKSPKQRLNFKMLVSSSCDYFCWKKEGNLNSVLSQLYYHSWTQLPLVQKKRSLDNFNPSKSCGTQTSLPQPHSWLLLIAPGDAGLHLEITDWHKDQQQAAVNSGEHFWIPAVTAWTLRHQEPLLTNTLGEDVSVH